MKKYQLTGLIVPLVISMSLTIPGFINVTLSIYTRTDFQYSIWWLLGAIGIFFYLIFLLWVLFIIFKKRLSGMVTHSQIRSAVKRQITFSFINILLGLSIGAPITVFALFALSDAVNARNEGDDAIADKQMKTARSFNIVAFVFAAVQWAIIILFLSSIQKA